MVQLALAVAAWLGDNTQDGAGRRAAHGRKFFECERPSWPPPVSSWAADTCSLFGVIRVLLAQIYKQLCKLHYGVGRVHSLFCSVHRNFVRAEACCAERFPFFRLRSHSDPDLSTPSASAPAPFSRFPSRPPSFRGSATAAKSAPYCVVALPRCAMSLLCHVFALPSLCSAVSLLGYVFASLRLCFAMSLLCRVFALISLCSAMSLLCHLFAPPCLCMAASLL